MTNTTPSTATKGKSGYFGKFVGAAVLGGLFWFTRGRKTGASIQDSHSAAFANRETDPENLDPTRSSGSAETRDVPRRDREPVDDADDGPFPARNPPAY
ncbi:MAG: hypothetical protein EOP63_09675 [Sphingomonadales bacterium]|nr:MAG: hypothetical protein EOP63_09675 [Sphingomonadales bacterium]